MFSVTSKYIVHFVSVFLFNSEECTFFLLTQDFWHWRRRANSSERFPQSNGGAWRASPKVFSTFQFLPLMLKKSVLMSQLSIQMSQPSIQMSQPSNVLAINWMICWELPTLIKRDLSDIEVTNIFWIWNWLLFQSSVRGFWAILRKGVARRIKQIRGQLNDFKKSSSYKTEMNVQWFLVEAWTRIMPAN